MRFLYAGFATAPFFPNLFAAFRFLLLKNQNAIFWLKEQKDTAQYFYPNISSMITGSLPIISR